MKKRSIAYGIWIFLLVLMLLLGVFIFIAGVASGGEGALYHLIEQRAALQTFPLQ